MPSTGPTSGLQYCKPIGKHTRVEAAAAAVVVAGVRKVGALDLRWGAGGGKCAGAQRRTSHHAVGGSADAGAHKAEG